MNDDEKAIRELVATWLRATTAGDISTILSLMAEDVVFLVPGKPPMRGREAFAGGFTEATSKFRIESSSEVQEIQVLRDWAYVWSFLTVTMNPLNFGSPIRRSGPTLSILRKQPDGGWLMFRDANMLAPEGESNK